MSKFFKNFFTFVCCVECAIYCHLISWDVFVLNTCHMIRNIFASHIFIRWLYTVFVFNFFPAVIFFPLLFFSRYSIMTLIRKTFFTLLVSLVSLWSVMMVMSPQSNVPFVWTDDGDWLSYLIPFLLSNTTFLLWLTCWIILTSCTWVLHVPAFPSDYPIWFLFFWATPHFYCHFCSFILTFCCGWHAGSFNFVVLMSYVIVLDIMLIG